MIYSRTKLIVADNTGAYSVKCIQFYKGSGKKQAFLSEVIQVSISKIKVLKKINKKTIYNNIIVSSKSWTKKLDGSFIKAFKNRGLLLDKFFKFLGTRIYGPVPKELLQGFNFLDNDKSKKIISFSKYLI